MEINIDKIIRKKRIFDQTDTGEIVLMNNKKTIKKNMEK